jgi:hypothetical protein
VAVLELHGIRKSRFDLVEAMRVRLAAAAAEDCVAVLRPQHREDAHAP